MAEQTGQDIEFLPSDELIEPEIAASEDEAIHRREHDEPRSLMTVEAAYFDADQLDEDVADELEVEADEAAEAEAEAAEEVAEEHEEDVEEILRRHYGIVSTEPEVEPARRPTGITEFVCGSCFLRKPTSQQAGPERSICVDCAANGG